MRWIMMINSGKILQLQSSHSSHYVPTETEQAAQLSVSREFKKL